MDSRPEKKTEQDALLEIQMNAAEKAKVFDIFTAATFLIVIFGIALAMFIIPDETFSEQENRALQQLPKISSGTEGSQPFDRLVSGEYTLDIAKYYADQLPFRDFFVGLKGMVEISLMKRENNGVILGKDDFLITKDTFTTAETREQIDKNTSEIGNFADVMSQMKVPVTLALAGRTVDAMASYLPPTYPMNDSNNLWQYYSYSAGNYKSIKNLNLLDPLKLRIERNANEQLYYRTDHHWTTLGAYYAYAELMKSFKEDGLTALPLSAFRIETASDSFYGTTWSKAGMKWIKPDTVNYYRYAGDDDFVTAIKDTGVSFGGFYDRSYLDKKDKYSSFIGGNNARVDIIKPGETGRPKLLLLKDSFGHSVVPFLAYHYDLIILDLRYYSPALIGSVAQTVFNENISRVVFLYNIDNFKDEDSFDILRSRLESVLHDYIMSQYPVKNIYINDNSIEDYSIICREDKNSVAAAELLQSTILEKMGIEIDIIQITEDEDLSDLSRFDKTIIFTDEGLPAKGFMKIATEGSNLVFRCNISDGAGYSVGRFIEKYLKKAQGSFNFGSDFIFSDMSAKDIMIMPGS